VAWLCQAYNIPIFHPTGNDNNSDSSMLAAGIIGHSQISLSGKTDPGPYFDWNAFISLVADGGGGQRPNLVANTVSLGSTTIVAGGSTTVSYHMENNGTATAAASVSKVYLSTDSNITTSDTLLGSTNDGSLTNGFYFPDSVNVTLSGSLAPGTYWVGVIADA